MRSLHPRRAVAAERPRPRPRARPGGFLSSCRGSHDAAAKARSVDARLSGRGCCGRRRTARPDPQPEYPDRGAGRGARQAFLEARPPVGAAEPRLQGRPGVRRPRARRVSRRSVREDCAGLTRRAGVLRQPQPEGPRPRPRRSSPERRARQRRRPRRAGHAPGRLAGEARPGVRGDPDPYRRTGRPSGHPRRRRARGDRAGPFSGDHARRHGRRPTQASDDVLLDCFQPRVEVAPSASASCP